MKPKLFEVSSCNNNVYKQIIMIIEEFESKDYFSDLIGKLQPKQKKNCCKISK